MNSIVAEDETWCFRYDPTTKCPSAEWKSPASPKDKKVRLQKSNVKTMLVCFYDSKGIIHHEFVPEGQTVNGRFYLSVLERLWKRIRRVRPEYSAPGNWFLLHDNAPVHRAVVVQEFLARKQVCVLHHPPYSPDLSPCDYILFPKLKLPLKGRLFEDVQDRNQYGFIPQTSTIDAIMALKEFVQEIFRKGEITVIVAWTWMGRSILHGYLVC